MTTSLRIAFVKSLVLFRMRVNDTKLPYLWLFLPILLRIAPFALLVFALSNNENGLRFVQITLMTAPCSILLRRIFRIQSLHKRIPAWLNHGTQVIHSLYSFVLLTFIESIIPVLVISFGVYVSTGLDAGVALRFCINSYFILLLGLILVVFSCPAILVAYKKYEDVRHGTRYSFMFFNLLLMSLISASWKSNLLSAFIPGAIFVELTGIPYGDFSGIRFFIGIIYHAAVIFVLLAKFPMKKINEIDEQIVENDLGEQL